MKAVIIFFSLSPILALRVSSPMLPTGPFNLFDAHVPLRLHCGSSHALPTSRRMSLRRSEWLPSPSPSLTQAAITGPDKRNTTSQ